MIALLKVKQGRGQPIRSDGPQRHIVEKQGTPTMGGLMILSGTFVVNAFCGPISAIFMSGRCFSSRWGSGPSASMMTF